MVAYDWDALADRLVVEDEELKLLPFRQRYVAEYLGIPVQTLRSALYQESPCGGRLRFRLNYYRAAARRNGVEVGHGA